MLTKRTTVIVCALIGVTLELGIHVLTGRREAWDAGEYWSLGLPLALCASTAVGIFARDTDWRWTAIVAPSQVFTMMVRSGEIGTLFPLTLMLSAIFSLPFLGAAFLGSRVRRRLPLGLH